MFTEKTQWRITTTGSSESSFNPSLYQDGQWLGQTIPILSKSAIKPRLRSSKL